MTRTINIPALSTDQLKTLLANHRRLNALHRPEYAEAAAELERRNGTG
jgi:hypothetical protein